MNGNCKRGIPRWLGICSDQPQWLCLNYANIDNFKEPCDWNSSSNECENSGTEYTYVTDCESTSGNCLTKFMGTRFCRDG